MTSRRWTAFLLSAAFLGGAVLALVSCATRRPPAVTGPLPPSPAPSPGATPAAPTPTPTPTPGEAQAGEPAAPNTTQLALSVWSEPRRLQQGGGQALIIIRVQTPGNKPAPGLDVRLKTSEGSLYSQGRSLVTDARGMTRDRLTTSRTAKVEVQVAGLRQEIVVPVGEAPTSD